MVVEVFLKAYIHIHHLRNNHHSNHFHSTFRLLSRTIVNFLRPTYDCRLCNWLHVAAQFLFDSQACVIAELARISRGSCAARFCPLRKILVIILFRKAVRKISVVFDNIFASQGNILNDLRKL